MGKNWLIVTSVAFGVGFSLSLAVTRQVRTSALMGLVTIPASAAGVFVANRQRQQEVFTGLQAEIRKLERQKETLKRSLQTLQDYQAATQATYVQAQQELDANLQQLQTQLEADQQKHHSLQSDLAALEQQRQTLEQALATTRQQAHDAEAQLAELRSQVPRLQAQLAETSQEKATLQQAVRTLETQQQSLTAAIAQLTAHEQALQTQEANLQTSLANLAEQQQRLNCQLEADCQERQHLQQDLDNLALHRQELTATTAALDSQLQDMRAQHQALTLTLRQQTEEQGRLEQHLSQLRQQLQTDRQQHDSLTQNLEALSRQADQLQERIKTLTQEQQQLTSQRDELVAALQQLPVQVETAQAQQEPYRASQIAVPSATSVISDLPASDTTDDGVEPNAGVDGVEPSPAASLEPTIVSPEPVRPFRPLVEPTDFRLADPEHTEWLWEEVIDPRWQCRPFLGSVCLPREDTDEVWGTETIVTIVGQNLRRLGENNLNCDYIYERFDDEDNRNWLKILTFVMSECAYHMEAASGFWQGLCNRLNLPYQSDNAIPVTTLKTLAEDGIDLLNLPRAVGGYPIVSTLWLQSGIPYRNLHHFADLVADLVDQLGWSAIQNREARSLARELLNTCQNNYPGRTVLQRFLAYSCQPDAEPVAGELLQSIASVAIALRDYQQAPEILLNSTQRQEFLVDRVPQFKFFLRDWQALAQILRPDRPGINRRSGHKPLTLRLDLETFTIELVLPAQTLRNADWPAGVCSIPAVDWHGEIDAEGQIEIEELTQSVEQIAEEWQWPLLDAQATPLHPWEVEGIRPDVPCLIFDAWTGDRLLPNPDLTDNPEIFCFVPNGTTVSWDAVEQLDDRVPCSIQGWQGQRLRLAGQFGQLHVQCPDSAPVTLRWQLAPTEPSLRGLHLPGQVSDYLEPPTLWYPPHTAALSLNLTLEERSLEEPAPSIQQTVSLPANDRWSPVPLNQWPDRP
ncbi:MAG TPA: hypothetical protein IGS37_03495, partial [Synechococcales cyanobacterium M55_K2018_004]|nr:hypothetical protein [Synechococcales cyanobacterium M55_K2018_004]